MQQTRNGRGDVVGTELSTNADVARISFTGSSGTGKIIARQALDTMKRVSLALGGKSPTILLGDANFETAVPAALNIAFGTTARPASVEIGKRSADIWKAAGCSDKGSAPQLITHSRGRVRLPR
jgi:delta 1-pyrroline-5-carboxylate dehydrogenase